MGLAGTFISVAQASEKIAYVGLLDNGWQVHSYEIESNTITQLTTSDGDKRTPIFSKEFGGYIYKNAEGKICLVRETGEESILVDIPHCGDFTINNSDIYFTRLSTGNAQRQFVWKATGAYPTTSKELVYRPEFGSIRQLQYNDGKILATHIYKVGEEQVIIIDLKDTSQHEVLTPPKKMASYPRWISDEVLCVSVKGDNDNYDLFQINVKEPNKLIPFVTTEESSEFYTSFNDNSSMVFERLNETGKWHLVIRNTDNGIEQTLALPTAAKEPVFVK